VDVRRRGGNAIDAAVAAAFTLSVTYPAAGSLGGGGFLLYRSPEGRYLALDFREVAPRALRPELFLDEAGRPVSERSRIGGLAVGVPGVVAGLAEAHRRWGTLPWEELISPALKLADAGFTLSSWNARTFARRADDLLENPGTAEIFTRDGAPLAAGDRLVQTALAEVLHRIASDGAAGFYRGPTAAAVARTVRETGGVLDTDDLASYEPALREPVHGTYRGYRVTSFPPPSSGGVVLLQILGMLERFDLAASGFGSSLTVHRMAEAARRAYADRSRWIGDPDFFDAPVETLLDADYLEDRASTIKKRKATPSRKVGPGRVVVAEPTETTHLSVADGDGGAVAMTITLNQWFGAALVAGGVVLNNQMDDFATAPGSPDLYGLVGGEANAPAGGKRPLSSMTPTIVEAPGNGSRPCLVLGSPGGPTIISAVLQVLVNVIDHGMPLQEAVDAPRFHHQWLPDRISHEPRSFPADVVRALERRGHELHPTGPIANVSAIGLADDGAWLGAADPRRQGRAAGY
jgi:gamma-glutamyltranspeptidase/glutathione hydrolase